MENRRHRNPAGPAGFGVGEASNYLNARLRGPHPGRCRGRSARRSSNGERRELDTLTAKIVAEGLATLAQPADAWRSPHRGKGADRARAVASAGYRRRPRPISSGCARCSTRSSARTISSSCWNWQAQAMGVRIFIGSENRLFSLVRLLHRCRALCQCRRAIVGRDRRSGTDPAQLWPHHPDGGPYRQSHWTIARLMFKEACP